MYTSIDKPKLRIDAEFASLCPPAGADELALLEEDLKANGGCRDLLVVWKDHGILLDGHQRYGICRKHGLGWQTVAVELPDRAAVRAFILRNQLGKRNLTLEAASYLRGSRYLEEKQGHGGARPRAEGNASAHFEHLKTAEEASAQSEHLKTADRLAAEFHVGQATIRRDVVFAEAVDGIVANCGPESRALLLTRGIGLRRGAIRKLAKMKPAQQQQFLAYLKEHGRPPCQEYTRKSSKAAVRVYAQRLAHLGPDRALAVIRATAKLLGIALPRDFGADPAT